MSSIGDKISLKDARGGWDGFIADRHGAPGGRSAFLIRSPARFSKETGTTLADEVDIQSGTLSQPTFSVGDKVTLGSRGGEVTADLGNDTYEVEIDTVINKHLTATRKHKVARWRLALENS